MILSSNGADVIESVARPGNGMRRGGYGLTQALTGGQVTRERAMGIPALWSGVMLLAKTAGTLPLETVNRANHNQVVEVADVAKRLRWQPNREIPAAVFWTTLFTHLIPSGNAYGLKLPAGDKFVRAPEQYLVPPELVQVYRHEGQIYYDFMSPDGGAFAQGVHASHVIHYRGPSLGNPLLGASLVEIHRNSLGIALASQEYQGVLFRNGGTPKGILSVDETLDAEQASTIRDQWHATYGGMSNAGKIAVLDRGATFQSTSANNHDAQLIEQLQLSATDCARLLNLPAALINAEGASLTYANASHNDLHFLKFSLRPWLVLVEQALNMDPDYFGVDSAWEPVFKTDAVVSPDQSQRYANYGVAIGSGWMKKSEARLAEGLSAVAGIDDEPAPVAPVPMEGERNERSLDQHAERSIVVNMPDQSFQVNPPSVNVEIRQDPQPAPTVNVAAPNVRVDAPKPVAPPEVHVHVPEQAAPVVNVESPTVNVEAPNVQVDVAAPSVTVEPEITVTQQSTKSVKFNRDGKGQIIGAEVEPEA